MLAAMIDKLQILQPYPMFILTHAPVEGEC